MERSLFYEYYEKLRTDVKEINTSEFNKLKDGYVVLDTSSNICYFKKITLDKFIKKNAARIFNTTTDALRLLGCRRKDYHEGEKNIWHVTLPEFISHESIKPKTKDQITELDEAYHDKFRTGETESDTQKNY